MKSVPYYYWTVTERGKTRRSSVKMSREEAEQSYPGLAISPIEDSRETRELPETEEEKAAALYARTLQRPKP